VARSTTSISNLFILTAIAEAAHGASTTFILALAFASYLSLHPLLLFPSLAMLCYDEVVRRTKTTPNASLFAISHALGLSVAIAALLYISALLTGSWEFVSSTYGVRLLLPDLTPNAGLWWYFFIEMFDSFREFFLGVFWLHMASYVGGLGFRLKKQPLFVAVALIGIFAIFQPYPSIADTALYLALVPLYRHVFPRKCARS
jgi:GPI-anchor transamidase subunit U